LADGLRDTIASHVIMEFKYLKGLNESTVGQGYMYHRMYGEKQGLKPGELESFLIISRTPMGKTLKSLGYEPTDPPGVYRSKNPLVRFVTLIVINELADKPHNALFKCFASRMKERNKGFETAQKSEMFRMFPGVERPFFALRRILMGNPEFDITTYDPRIEGWTPEYMMWLGQRTIDQILAATPPEQLFKSPNAAKVLEHHKLEGWREGRQEGRQEGIFEGTAKTLLRQLTKRFGPALPVWVNPKLQSADEHTLELWTERILDVATLEDVFNP
jgi:hypothetical protein